MIKLAEVTTMKRGDRWQYRFEAAKIDGKRQRISKSGFRTKKEALEAGTKALAEYNQCGQHFVASEISFSDYLDYWLNNYCLTNLKQTTFNSYAKRINNYIRPALGAYKLKSLTPSILQEYINNFFNSGISRNTLSCVKGLLSGCLTYAVEPLHFIQTNPMLFVRLPSPRAVPSVPSNFKERRVCTKEEIDKIFERFPYPHSAYIPLQLAYRCGLRLGEAFALSWNDVDFDKHTLSINHQIQMNEATKCWTFSPPKYNSIRTIRIDDFMLNLLQKHKSFLEKSEMLYQEYFTHLYINAKNELNSFEGEEIKLINVRENGTYIQPRIMQHVSRVIHGKTSEPAISEDWDYHSLRHTHATMLLEAGVNPKEVQHRLGHKNIKVTLDIYSHFTEKMEDEAVTILNELF